MIDPEMDEIARAAADYSVIGSKKSKKARQDFWDFIYDSVVSSLLAYAELAKRRWPKLQPSVN